MSPVGTCQPRSGVPARPTPGSYGRTGARPHALPTRRLRILSIIRHGRRPHTCPAARPHAAHPARDLSPNESVAAGPIEAVAQHRHDWPEHLTAALGPPPTDRRNHDRWEQAAFAIEKYRLRWHITDPHRPLGREPGDPLQRTDHRRAVHEIEHARRESLADRVPVRTLQRGISR